MFGKYIARQYRRPSGLIGRWIGQKMAEQHRPENLWTIRLLDIQATDQVLEVGFGPGFAVQEIVPLLTTGSVSGVDFSRTMVNAARRRNAQAIRAGRADLRYGTVTQLPYPDSTFDKTFSINCVYFWTQPLTAFQELWRVLKPGGLLAVTLLPLERWNTESYGVPEATAEFKPYSLDELHALFSQAGFHNIRVEADPDLNMRSNCSVSGQKTR